MKGWGPKSFVCPSKLRETKVFGGILDKHNLCKLFGPVALGTTRDYPRDKAATIPGTKGGRKVYLPFLFASFGECALVLVSGVQEYPKSEVLLALQAKTFGGNFVTGEHLRKPPFQKPPFLANPRPEPDHKGLSCKCTSYPFTAGRSVRAQVTLLWFSFVLRWILEVLENYLLNKFEMNLIGYLHILLTHVASLKSSTCLFSPRLRLKPHISGKGSKTSCSQKFRGGSGQRGNGPKSSQGYSEMPRYVLWGFRDVWNKIPTFFAHPFFLLFLPFPPHPSPGNFLPQNPVFSGTSDLLFLVEKRQPPGIPFSGARKKVRRVHHVTWSWLAGNRRGKKKKTEIYIQFPVWQPIFSTDRQRASGKGPHQKKNLKSFTNISWHFSTSFGQGKKRQEVSNIFPLFSTIFARHLRSCPFFLAGQPIFGHFSRILLGWPPRILCSFSLHVCPTPQNIALCKGAGITIRLTVQMLSRKEKHKNINKFWGLSRDWVGGKNLLMCFFGSFLMGENNT